MGRRRKTPIYNRVILKLTGEIFVGLDEKGNRVDIDEEKAVVAAQEVKSIHDLGVQVAVVLGGGNIARGRNYGPNGRIKKETWDFIGMKATIQNGMAFNDVISSCGMESKLMSALFINQVAEPYYYRVALNHLEKGRIVILVGGTAMPNFTTDATAICRACELGADALLKGTKVDGIFDKDPMKFADALFLPQLTVEEARALRPGVLEESALVLNTRNKPIHVFNIFTKGNLRRLLLGEPIGSRIIF